MLREIIRCSPPVLQATALSTASASAAAWCLAAHVDEALGRTTGVRDRLYGWLLAALQLRLAEVCQGEVFEATTACSLLHFHRCAAFMGWSCCAIVLGLC